MALLIQCTENVLLGIELRLLVIACFVYPWVEIYVYIDGSYD